MFNKRPWPRFAVFVMGKTAVRFTGLGLLLILLTYSLIVNFLGGYVAVIKTAPHPLTLVYELMTSMYRQDFSGYLQYEVPNRNQLYGQVSLEALPWYDEDRFELDELRGKWGATTLVSAFRTTLPNPMGQEDQNVRVGARHLAGTIVKPGEVFSLNRALGPRTRARGYGDGPMYIGGRVGKTLGGGICKIASTLYNLAIISGLKVLERHPHSMQVPYVPPGRDATIAKNKDLRFRNNQDTPIIIWSQVQENTLYIAFYGKFIPPMVQWHHQELRRQKTWVNRYYDPSLPPGQEQEIMEGYDGITVRTWIIVTYPEKETTIDLGIDYYRPLPRIIRYGPKS